MPVMLIIAGVLERIRTNLEKILEEMDILGKAETI